MGAGREGLGFRVLGVRGSGLKACRCCRGFWGWGLQEFAISGSVAWGSGFVDLTEFRVSEESSKKGLREQQRLGL